MKKINILFIVNRAVAILLLISYEFKARGMELAGPGTDLFMSVMLVVIVLFGIEFLNNTLKIWQSPTN